MEGKDTPAVEADSSSEAPKWREESYDESDIVSPVDCSINLNEEVL
jgi:hypothetical protein